jgi:putative transcriptional regulator
VPAIPRSLRPLAGLCAGGLLVVMAWWAVADDAQSLTTVLLVARAELPDSNFRDSIVLVMNNVGPAPGGVIVNRPTRIPVSRLFPEVARLAPLDDKVYFGGPVQINLVSFVFRADTQPDAAIPVLEGVYMSANRTLLEKLLARDKPMEGLRIFIGYSGWSPGQLEGEIARGDWTLKPADADTIFGRKSERIWPEDSAPEGARRT